MFLLIGEIFFRQEIGEGAFSMVYLQRFTLFSNKWRIMTKHCSPVFWPTIH